MRYAIWNEFVAVDVEAVLAPRDTEEVARMVERARAEGKHVKAVGAGHSFNDLALTEDLLIDLRRLDRIVEIDAVQRLVRVQAGMPLHALVRALAAVGLALANIGAWTQQTIAGVLSTATHGTNGRYRKTLIGSLVELTLVDGRGQIRVLRGEEVRWLTLGFFGVITEVVIQAEPLFFVRQSNLVLDGVEAITTVPEQLARHDFVDLRWVGRVPRVIVRRWDIIHTRPTRLDRTVHHLEGARLGALNGLLSLIRASALRGASNPVFHQLGRAYVAQGKGLEHAAVYHECLTFNSLGIAAPHEERELALPLERATACLLAAREEMIADPASASLEIQVRFSPAGDVNLAPDCGRETCWFNINVLDPRASPEVVERLCQIALAHGARPHWAKIIPARMPRLAALYGDVPLQWEARRRGYDPDGLFLNDWYHRHLGFVGRSRPEQDEQGG
jgi:FAD/FMN-containing dehydrogenase